MTRRFGPLCVSTIKKMLCQPEPRRRRHEKKNVLIIILYLFRQTLDNIVFRYLLMFLPLNQTFHVPLHDYLVAQNVRKQYKEVGNFNSYLIRHVLHKNIHL